MPLFSYLKRFIAKPISINSDEKNLFNHYFFELKYFLHQTSSTENFAQLLNISTKNVNQISNDCHGVNFTRLINQCRFDYLIKELENPINSNLPIESVIKLCGFKNIESFYQFIETKKSSKTNSTQVDALATDALAQLDLLVQRE